MQILFVCTANICRSAMAEALLSYELASSGDRVTVASAGIEVNPRLTPDKNTNLVCSGHGLDVSSHQPRQLTQEMLNQSDIVLCLAENHRDRILGAYPTYESKVFLLKEFRRQERVKHPSVEDPTGRSLRHYKKCFREIQSEVKRIIPLLK